ncbi:MAG TPA: choice-of-anchor D domain-containing protein [Verrucomicrobiae bacterium]|nr:choice-of-anchor D domain-containing protein [Verrucomicrobiae bacterium]
MRRVLSVAWLAGVAGLALAVSGDFGQGARRENTARHPVSTRQMRLGRTRAREFLFPPAFEAPAQGTGQGVQFVTRGGGIAVGLGNVGILLRIAGKEKAQEKVVTIEFENGGKMAHRLKWKGQVKLPGEANYFVGRDARIWRRHVARYARAEASVFPGVRAAAYEERGEIEYDLRVEPGAELNGLGLRIRGAEKVRLDDDGNLRIWRAGRQIVMKRPGIFEEGKRKAVSSIAQNSEERDEKRIEGGYVMRADGSVGFWLGARDNGNTLVIDPTLTLEYATFLGGPGGTEVNSAALDAQGNLYVGGETAATGSFPGTTAQSEGVAGASSYLFVAKINPGVSGPGSLEWLTFIGGNTTQSGGAIAVDEKGNVAIAGTTTSSDYPVTDGSAMAGGTNAAVVTVLDQSTGGKLNFSSVLAGSGAEANENAGGVAIDGSGNIYIASDTTSTDLCTKAEVTTPYQATYGGGATDGFLAMYTPGATPTLRYCTYLGIFAEVGVTGLAVDSKENVFLAGYTSQPINPTTFPSTANGFQPNYGGGNYDGFVVKISPSGNGLSDLSYATYLGGTGADQVMAIAVDSSQLPATAYVAGTTNSADFPMGVVAAYQGKDQAGLGGTNAFLAVVRQNAAGMTTLEYSTYLGGSGVDSGMSVAELAPNAVYLAGSASSTDFPWLDNMQPQNGDSDAFVAKLDTTTPGSAGLKFATPLGGTPSPGVTATSSGNAVAAMSAAGETGDVNVYVGGTTNASDFPQAPGAAATGVELTCASCPGVANGFVAGIVENPSGAAGPSVEFSPAVVKFANTGIQNYPGVNVGIKNTGDETLTISGISLTQTGSDFSLVPATPCSGMTLPAGSSEICSFEVDFTSSTPQTEGATIEVEDNAAGGEQVLEVEGVSASPQATVTPGNLNFGSVAVGTTGWPQYVTLTNTGGQPLSVAQFAFSPSVYYGMASGSVGVNGGCLTIPAGGSCVYGVWFKPAATGLVNGTLVITDNSGNQPETEQTVMLSGTGATAAAIATLVPNSLTFASQTVGTTSAAQTVTLTNTGSGTLDLKSVALLGSAAGFAMSGGAEACPAGGGTIPPQGSCSVIVTFTPSANGAAAGSLNFYDNAGTGEQSVSLSGTGSSTGTVSVGPDSISFAPQSVGTASAPTSVTLTNTGSAPVAIGTIGVSGTNAQDFSESTNCSGSVASGKSCVIQVTFAPTAPGSRTAMLSVADAAAGSPQTVPLTGTATQAALKLSATSLSFSPAQLIGTASAAQTVTVSSTGTGALAITRIAFSGADGADFTETDNCTGTGGVSIPSGQTCTIHAVFTPQAQDAQCGATAGARCATMTLTDNAGDSPQSVALSGTVMDFEIAPPAGGSLAQTVTAGGTATYNLEIDPSGGFTGSVALTCSEPVAISGTSCSVSPTSVTVTASGPGAFTVSVPTTAAESAAWKRQSGKSNSDGIEEILLVLLFSFGMACLPGERRRERLFGAAAGLALAVALTASCGGGGSAATDPPFTSTGTYANAVTVTATTGTGATAATRTAELTLVVQ